MMRVSPFSACGLLSCAAFDVVARVAAAATVAGSLAATRRRLATALRRALCGAAFMALAGCAHDDGPWALANISGHLPDLNFSLVADSGQPVTAQAFRGKVPIVYFGYTHCPDVCPTTLAHLTDIIHQLGDDGRDVRVLFISVDPARDTPPAMHAYVTAFDAQHAVGLTGTDSQIEDLARRYRVAYQPTTRDAHGDYEVTHSSALYFFDRAGHARLLGTADDPSDKVLHDLRRLIHSTP